MYIVRGEPQILLNRRVGAATIPTCRLPSQAFLMDGIWDRDLALVDGRSASGHGQTRIRKNAAVSSRTNICINAGRDAGPR
jgi:hypothetical protein